MTATDYDEYMSERRHFGSMRKRSSGRYEVSFWHEGVRRTGPHTFGKKSEALAWLSAVETDLKRGAWVDPNAGRISFSDYARTWLTARVDLRPRSFQQYSSLLDRHLIPAFGTRPLAEITVANVRAWFSSLTRESPGAAASAYRLLRTVCNAAVADDLIVRSPCRVPGGGADRASERPMLTVAELAVLTDAMPDELRAAMALAGWGGLRRGEVLGLRRKDVDTLHDVIRIDRAQVELNNGRIVFAQPKTAAGVRSVHLSNGAMHLVEAHLARYVEVPTESLLFTGVNGGPLRPRVLATAFRRARAECGLPGVHFHDLRHFALTMAATTGASTKELMRRAGHASPVAALRYQHATEARDQAIADALSRLDRPAPVVAIGEAQATASRPQRAHGASRQDMKSL